MSLGFAFTSGTREAFLHNTLVGLKKENKYSEISGKIGANASLISALLILLLPLLTKISLVMPIKIYLIFDILGIFMVFSLVNPKVKFSAEDEEGENILSQLKRFYGNGFYLTSIFLGLIGGFATGLTPFKEPFVKSLGFPIIFIGSIMAFSRIVWFLLGHNLKNPYMIGFLIAVLVGYYQGRRPVMEEYYLDNFLFNRRYKATMLSIKRQIGQLFQSIITFVIAYAMAVSFSLGYLISGLFLFVVLLILFLFLRKYLK